MRDFDQIDVSSGRRLRALAVAGIATVALVAAGIGYLHPRLALPAPPAKPKPAPSFQAVAPQRPITVKQLLYADGSLWFVFDVRGLTQAYRTVDAGASWTHVFEGPYMKLQVLDRSTAAATVGQIALLMSQVGGVEATQTLPAPVATGLGISYAFASPKHVLALLANGALYETTDFGAGWRPAEGRGIPAAGIKHDLGVTPGGRAWFLDATESGEFLYVSEDWGRSWRELTPRGYGAAQPLTIFNHGDELFASYSARVFQLLPRNASWDELPPPVVGGVLTLRPGGELVLAAGRQVYTLVPGSLWVSLPPPQAESVVALAAGNGDALYAAGESGSLYSFIGETREWLRLPSPFQYQWMAVPNSP